MRYLTENELDCVHGGMTGDDGCIPKTPTEIVVDAVKKIWDAIVSIFN
jgi:hypothetical protein